MNDVIYVVVEENLSCLSQLPKKLCVAFVDKPSAEKYAREWEATVNKVIAREAGDFSPTMHTCRVETVEVIKGG